MMRLLIGAVFLATSAAPAFAHGCPHTWTASGDTRPGTVAAQPANDHGARLPSMPADQRPS